MKRLFDIVTASLGLLILLPLLVVVAGVIWVSDGGPVFYRGRRVGQFGREFWLVKFRSMVVHADMKGIGITTSSDVRITPVGRWLRATKIDELPQLWNVLVGDMSFVGPRPEDPRYVALYDERQRRILNVRPGITSPASLRFKNESELLNGPDWEKVYREKILPEKLAMDAVYFSSPSFWKDMALIVQTVLGIARR